MPAGRAGYTAAKHFPPFLEAPYALGVEKPGFFGAEEKKKQEFEKKKQEFEKSLDKSALSRYN